LSQIPRRSRLDEWNARGETKTIDATTRGNVIERVEDERERLEVGNVKFRIVENVSVMGQVGGRVGVVAVEKRGDHEKRRLGSHLALGHADVSRSEEKLTIEIADVDGVEVDHFHVSKAGEGEVFEEFASDAAGADEEDARGEDLS
jgi:hypothetical protein